MDNGNLEKLRQLERRLDDLERKGSQPVTELQREVAVLFERDKAQNRTLQRLEKTMAEGLERIEQLVAQNEANREDEERAQQHMGIGRWTLIVMVISVVFAAIIGTITLILQATGAGG